ncbi:MAG: 2-amino-4-hydroxy-6-hydroxymethyldihydropteridine diphosphokinase [Candidatus Omnitrophota bacterium]
MKNWQTVYLGIGANCGDRKLNIKKAIFELKSNPAIKLVKISKIIETKPWGGIPQGKFLNGAIKIKTTLLPLSLLRVLKKIEKNLKRKKTIRFGPRTIDLDILIFADKIIKTKKLIVPHPRMLERDFVLKPLYQIIK